MYDVRESSPDVGSSKNMTCEFEISSKAMEILFRSPPDTPLIRIPPTNVSMHFSSRIERANLSTSIFLSFSEAFNLNRAAKSSVYLTVSVSIRKSCCIT